MIVGIDKNYSPAKTPKGYAFYAINVIINEKLDEIINERGTDVIHLLNTYTFINGVITFLDNVIVFGKSTEGKDVIAVYNETTKTIQANVNRTDLGFSTDHPISGEAKLNSKGELIVAFTDNFNTPKYINLTTALPSDSLALYNLTITNSNPFLSISVIEGGGVLKTGAYYVAIQYLDRNRAATQWSTLSEPIYIVAHKLSADFASTQGSESGKPTNKGLRILLADIDEAFTRVRVALVSKINDVVEAAVYKEVAISGFQMFVTVSGSELSTPLDISDIITKNFYFERVGELESLNDQLFAANIETTEAFDYQRIVNRIQLQWTSKFVNTPLYNQDNVDKAGNKGKSFMHDEVYAFYAQLELQDGRLTQWFHIPGDTLTSNDRLPVDNSDSGIKFNGAAPLNFQLNCNPGYIGTRNGMKYGTFARWENANEIYPNNFPDYGGQKVRHFRFPSIAFLKANVYNDGSHNFLGASDWDILGVAFSLDLNTIPFEYKSHIKGVRIGYAKRESADASVLGYSIIQLGAYPEINDPAFDTGVITSAGGNWRVQSANDANILATKDHVRLNSPDIFIGRPNVQDIYLYNQVRMRITDLNTSLFSVPGVRKYGRVLDGRTNGDIDVWTYLSNFMAAGDVGVIPPNNSFVALLNSKYLPAHTVFTDQSKTFNNLLNEEALYGQPNHSLDIDISGVDTGGVFRAEVGGHVDSPNLIEETFLAEIKTPKLDFFVNYTDQDVVPYGRIQRNLDGQILDQDVPGDVFIVTHSFMAMSSVGTDGQPFNIDPADGIRNLKMFLAESRYNMNERYTTLGDYTTYFYPAASLAEQAESSNYWFTKLDQTASNVNQILYSPDFNALQDLEEWGTFNHTIDYQTKLPYAIARSEASSRANDQDDGWRRFRPNDIFYTVKNKGRIVNLTAWGSEALLIHHELALFRTRDKAVLQTDITQINLGSGDLFALEPKEITPTDDGYGGTQHKFSCILCQAGYAFVDANVGEVFLYKGGDDFTPIAKGIRTDLRNFLRNNTVEDNPHKGDGSGLTMAFDKEHYRLVLSLKAGPNGVNGFTASFDLIKEEWSSFHSYRPWLLFNTRKNFYSLKDNACHQQGIGAYGHFHGILYPSFVDLVFNEEPSREKIISALEWISTVKDSQGNTLTETIDYVTIWSESHCTGKVQVNKRDNIANYENKNANQVDGVWRYNSINDCVKIPGKPFIYDINADYSTITSNLDNTLAWFEQAPVRGKYFIIRLEFSNLNNKSLSLRSMTPEIHLSYY
jgi:hypothetical protein